MTSYHAHLAHDADFTGWRAHIRHCLAQAVPPEEVIWSVTAPNDLFSQNTSRILPSGATPLRIPREQALLLGGAFLANIPGRFQQLHRFVEALAHSSDALQATFSLTRDVHAMVDAAWTSGLELRTAFSAAIRRGETILSWPDHLSAISQRHALSSLCATSWTVETPRFGVAFDGREITIGGTGPHNDYWSGLPSVVHSPTLPELHELQSLDALRAMAPDCHACELWRPATRTVFGEGPADAALMFVGEQPGDQEDLGGRPFVGPAGAVFDSALHAVGLERSACYVTNAVKHFRFTQRGPRRIHAKPDNENIRACAPWLEAERRLVRPRVLVMLGATAARAILGRDVTIARERSRPHPLSGDTQGIVTTHPSYLLRLPDEATRIRETERFKDDLRLARSLLPG